MKNIIVRVGERAHSHDEPNIRGGDLREISGQRSALSTDL